MSAARRRGCRDRMNAKLVRDSRQKFCRNVVHERGNLCMKRKKGRNKVWEFAYRAGARVVPTLGGFLENNWRKSLTAICSRTCWGLGQAALQITISVIDDRESNKSDQRQPN